MIGGDSSIAKNYIEYCNSNQICFDVTSRRKNNVNKLFFDLKNPDFNIFKDSRYEFVVFFASICSIQFCEENPGESFLINVKNTILSMLELQKFSKKILFISSNLIFDGSRPRMTIMDKPSPKTTYGRQKLEVEQEIAKLIKNASILRLSKVIHSDLDLLRSWKKELDMGNIIEAYSDMYLSPTPINRVIRKIENIRSDSFQRIYHCAGIDDLSYYEFALDFFKDHPNKNLIRKGYVMTKENIQDKIYSSLK